MRKYLLAFIFTLAGIGAAFAQAFPNYPTVGVPADTQCLSYGNYGRCTQYRPAGPNTLTGNETIPADTNAPNGQNPQTVRIPANLFAGGFGNATVSSTTGTTASVEVADGVGTFIYTGAGTATYTSFKLPANPIHNQKLCLANAGSGVLTLTAVAAGTNIYGNTPTIVGVTPTSVPVMTAVGTAGTVTLGNNCWLYQTAPNNTGIWYRVQ